MNFTNIVIILFLQRETEREREGGREGGRERERGSERARERDTHTTCLLAVAVATYLLT